MQGQVKGKRARTRNGEAIPICRWECAIADRDSNTPATVGQGETVVRGRSGLGHTSSEPAKSDGALGIIVGEKLIVNETRGGQAVIQHSLGRTNEASEKWGVVGLALVGVGEHDMGSGWKHWRCRDRRGYELVERCLLDADNDVCIVEVGSDASAGLSGRNVSWVDGNRRRGGRS